MIVAQQMYQQTQSFPMLALPFFMLAGSLMLGGKLGEELLGFATKAMQRWRGGPLSTTVVASVVFGGVSGSAVANASALGSVLIPWQKRQGYPAGLCAANNATSAIIDILIPPSIPLILYSLVSGVSIADLFTAGILPGILMAGGLILTCSLIARRRGIHSEDPAVSRMRAPEAGGAEQPCPADADPDPARPALRHRDADRDLGAGGGLCACAERLLLPRPDAGSASTTA